MQSRMIIVMIMCMIVMDIIPNYTYIVLFHFRGVCIRLYPSVSDVYAVCWCDVMLVFYHAVMMLIYWCQ